MDVDEDAKVRKKSSRSHTHISLAAESTDGVQGLVQPKWHANYLIKYTSGMLSCCLLVFVLLQLINQLWKTAR